MGSDALGWYDRTQHLSCITQILTCPRDAAATGSGEISEKSTSIGNPSSCSIVLNATSVENGVIRSCNKESSSRYVGGITSYKKNVEKHVG